MEEQAEVIGENELKCKIKIFDDPVVKVLLAIYQVQFVLIRFRRVAPLVVLLSPS